jgi:hypothetical protein
VKPKTSLKVSQKSRNFIPGAVLCIRCIIGEVDCRDGPTVEFSHSACAFMYAAYALSVIDKVVSAWRLGASIVSTSSFICACTNMSFMNFVLSNLD